MFEEKFKNLYQKSIDITVNHLPQFITGIFVLIIGWWLIKRIVKIAQDSFVKRNLDPSIESFSKSAISVILKVILLIIVAGMFGIKTSSLVAVLGAAGLTVGLALQGSLSNLAAGVLILSFKPFKVGDIIESGNQSGRVISIQFFNTVLETSDHKTVIIPNNQLSNGTIVNVSKLGNLRTSINFKISDYNKSEKIFEIAGRVIESDKRILNDPKPKLLITGFSGRSVELSISFFSILEVKDSVASDTYKSLIVAFEKENILDIIVNEDK
ncbi:MAG: mechanosensitive ion channel family protein [Bacteroidota bacterium]|jgi:small conductance mechanosensitive channel